MTPRPIKKKLILINRDFQFRYAGAGIAASLVASLLMASLILYPLFAFKILTSIYFLPWPFFVGIMLAVILNMLVQLVFGIVMTHRIAGPMYGMIRTIRQIGAGKWSAQVRLRTQDELQMIGRHLNEMSEQLVRAGMDDLVRIEHLSSEIARLDINQTSKDSLTNELANLAANIKKRIYPPNQGAKQHD